MTMTMAPSSDKLKRAESPSYSISFTFSPREIHRPTRKPFFSISKSVSPKKKLPPPPPRKPLQLARSHWIMDNLQMSITSDIEHSDIDIDEHKRKPIKPPGLAPLALSAQLRLPDLGRPTHTRSKSMTPIEKRKKTKNRRCNGRSNTIENEQNASPTLIPHSPEVDIPSLRSVNRRKAELTEQRLYKKRQSQRKLIRRQSRKWSGKRYYNYESSSSDSDNDHRHFKRKVNHTKSHSAPFGLKKIKLNELMAKTDDETPQPRKYKKRNKFWDADEEADEEQSKKRRQKRKTHKNTKGKSPRSPRSPRSPGGTLSRIKDNKANRPSRTKYGIKGKRRSPRMAYAVSFDDTQPKKKRDSKGGRRYKIKSIPDNAENMSYWSKLSNDRKKMRNKKTYTQSKLEQD